MTSTADHSGARRRPLVSLFCVLSVTVSCGLDDRAFESPLGGGPSDTTTDAATAGTGSSDQDVVDAQAPPVAAGGGNECLPGTTECVSPVQFKQCSPEGAWSEPQECEAACVDGVCGGVCKPHDTQCSSDSEVQTCTDQGSWGEPAPCANACVGKACTGECIATATRCPSATQVQTCNAMGQWETPQLCPLACVGTSCGGDCAPNTGRCDPDTGSPQQCTDQGGWQDVTSCPFVCIGSGTCGGECVPASRRCNPMTGSPQLCSPTGGWTDQPACEFACLEGFCGGECRPSTPRCDPISGVPQRCDGSGQWQNQAACGADRACSSGNCVCTAGSTDCGEGACVDTSTDANHCGTCNHGCGGGTCSGGACQPFILVSSEQFAHDLIVSGDSLYYGSLRPTRENIKRMPKSGGVGSTLVESPTTGNANTFGSIAIDGDSVFWVANSNPGTTIAESIIVRARASGAEAANFYAPATPPASIGPLFSSGGFLYWTATSGTQTTLLRSSIADEIASPTTIARADSGVVSSQTVSGECFFYNTTASTTQLFRACAGGPADLVHTSSTALSFGRWSSDASFIYFFEGSNAARRIQRQPFSGNPAPIGGESPRGRAEIAVDDDFAYYFEQTLSIGAPACTDGYTLFRVPKTGASTPAVLVPPPQNCPTDLYVDRDALYWVNSETGTIMKLAK